MISVKHLTKYYGDFLATEWGRKDNDNEYHVRLPFRYLRLCGDRRV